MANIVQTVQTKHKVWTKIQTKHEVWINAKYIFAKLDANLMQTKHANQWQTCLVQPVPVRCLDSSESEAMAASGSGPLSPVLR